MDDLISRAAAIECAINAIDDWDGGWNPNREIVIKKYFEELPAVDAVPVIHCRDCKYSIENTKHIDVACERSYDPEFYCATGERMDGNETD